MDAHNKGVGMGRANNVDGAVAGKCLSDTSDGRYRGTTSCLRLRW